jgi:hypothetical protein
MIPPRKSPTLFRSIRPARRRRRLQFLAICGVVIAITSVGTAGIGEASPVGNAGSAPSHLATPNAKYCGKRHVTVVVDFTHFRHGKVWVRCARNPRTGLAALRQAGFSYTFVAHQPGFICTINHRPKPCNGAPTSAYWAYWHAKHHGKWRYSNLGAASYHPKPGQVEGWAFGSGKKPRISPP